jgi:hypothetical protein
LSVPTILQRAFLVLALAATAGACSAKKAAAPKASAKPAGSGSGSSSASGSSSSVAAAVAALPTEGQARSYLPSIVREQPEPLASKEFPPLTEEDFHKAVTLDAAAQARKAKYKNGGVDADFPDPTTDPAAFDKAIADEIKKDMAQDEYDLENGVDLSAYDSPVKDQGDTGQCSAFSVVAAMENLLGGGAIPSQLDLSEAQQWQLQKMKPDVTAALGATLDGGGLVADLDFPNPKGQGVGRVTAWRLVAQSVLNPATKTRKPIDGRSLFTYFTVRMRPLIGVFRTNDSWWSDAGIIRAGTPLGTVVHAVEVVGILPSASDPLHAQILFKNSWGRDWGKNGYGVLSLSYCNDDYASDAKMYCAFYALDAEVPP